MKRSQSMTIPIGTQVGPFALLLSSLLLIGVRRVHVADSLSVPRATFITGRPCAGGRMLDALSSSALSSMTATSFGHRRSVVPLPPPSSYRFRVSNMARNDDNGNDVQYVEADDGDALQGLFSKFCDRDGLMTKEQVKSVPAIAELLKDGDLLPEELDDIWKTAPKFPIVDGQEDEKVDVDSFIQIYRDIDDFFEDDDDNDDNGDEKAKTGGGESASSPESVVAAAGAESGAAAVAATEAENVNNDAEPTKAGKGGNSHAGPDEESMSKKVMDEKGEGEEEEEEEAGEIEVTTAGNERELEIAFRSICDDAGLVTKDAVLRWDEVADLLSEGMLGEDEFDRIWKQTPKSPGTEQLDVDGFLSFNVALDDLFVFDDSVGEEEEEGDVENEGNSGSGAGAEPTVSSRTTFQKARPMIVGDDLPPGVIFAELADDNFLVGYDDLKRWGELQEMLEEGDMLPLELQSLFDKIQKAPGTSDKLDEDGFIALYDAIDAMFEDADDDDDDDDDDNGGGGGGGSAASTEAALEPSSVKSDLLSLLAEINSDEERLPCGLDSTDREQARVLNVVTALEAEASNFVQQRGGRLDQADLIGEWELLYSSSSAMKFNKGLTGLGGSFPNGRFGGLRQKLEASKYMSDVKYVEKIDIPGGNSFDVTVTGDWKLKDSMNLFSGEPTTVLNVEPDKVEYSFTSTRADHWKSLGPLNALDITYLDDDLRIMRGNTSTDTVFVFRRC